MTAGFAQTTKNNRSHTSGCSKRFLAQNVHTDDDLSLYSDDDIVYDDEDVCETTISSSRPPMSLSDFIVPAGPSSKRRHRR